MKKNTVRGLIVLAILLVAFIAIAFAVPFARTTVFWLGFGFAILAILFQLYIFKSAASANGDAKSRFYGFPIARIGVYYLVIQLVVSLVEMALAKVLPTWVALLINIILAAIAIIGCITVDTMRDEIVQQDGKLKKNVSNMRGLQSISATMVSHCSDEELRVTLQKLANEFRFSDPVSSEETLELEEDMHSQLGNIQQALVDGDTDGAKKMCTKLMGSLVERNRICSVSK